MSRASQLFIELSGDNSFQRISDLAANNAPETDYLEFKGGRIVENLQHVKEYWSKAISGFANTEGGILIFGIDARPRQVNGIERKIDAATGIELVRDPLSLTQLLKDLRGTISQDPVQGIDVCCCQECKSGGPGFVVCYVPEGEHKPYRASAQNVYFQRVQDQFLPLSHSHLRAMFYPRASARMVVTAKCVVDGVNPDIHYRPEMFIRNDGLATARDIWIELDEVPADLRPSFPGGHITVRGGSEYVATALDTPIHPGQSAPVGTVRWIHLNRSHVLMRASRNNTPVPAEQVVPTELHLRIFCENQVPASLRIPLTLDGANSHGKVFASVPDTLVDERFQNGL